MSFRIRSATLDDIPTIARIQTEGWRESFRGMLADCTLDGPLQENHIALWRRVLPELTNPPTLLAYDRLGHAAGFVSAGPPRGSCLPYESEIYAIYVVKSCQGLGLGVRFMHSMSSLLIDLDYRTMMLWTLEGNRRARAFYESLGGQPVARERHCFDGSDIVEIAYGWHGIRHLEQVCRTRLNRPRPIAGVSAYERNHPDS